MSVKLNRFRVHNFRSVEASEWIDVAENSCLVGTNEAGKTNLLIALWKLNPANNEPIVPLDDFPRHLYSNFKAGEHSKDVFVEADFELTEDFVEEIAMEFECDREQVQTVLVQRRYDGQYYIKFPYSKIDAYPSEKFNATVDDFIALLGESDSFLSEGEALRDETIDFVKVQKKDHSESLNLESISEVRSRTIDFIQDKFGRKQNLPKLFEKSFISKLTKMIDSFEGKPISVTVAIRKKVISLIPKFVYYSDYGNLDSEIYLPRVIEDFGRDDLSESARAKARTLEVLFKYVKLSPEEIYELGNDTKIIVKTVNQSNQIINTEEEEPEEAEIQEWADKKRERGVLLRSAASGLTNSFRKWWLQGNYIFDFEADGRHFRINVSDTLRPEPIELEGRSRGLQWFFSFFLVFLVETEEGHSNSILLLDEPGLSLHPIAQYDLAKFFRKLSENNQLLYTSHSPFLVDMDNLANVKAVFVDGDTGRTKVSADLRHDNKDAVKSIFPVHAALGLTVSDTLLLGCMPVLVEGPSDQIYLSMIKRHLVGSGKLVNTKEIVFIPTGGVRGMGPMTKLISSRDDELPHVILDSDKAGEDYQSRLVKDRYKDDKSKVIGVSEFIGKGEFEIEDLLPSEIITSSVDRIYRGEIYLEDIYVTGQPIVGQIEDWATKNSITLEKGWKVDLARSIQHRFDQMISKAPPELVEKWLLLFQKLTT